MKPLANIKVLLKRLPHVEIIQGHYDFTEDSLDPLPTNIIFRG